MDSQIAKVTAPPSLTGIAKELEHQLESTRNAPKTGGAVAGEEPPWQEELDKMLQKLRQLKANIG